MKSAEDTAIVSAKSIQPRKKVRQASLFSIDPQQSRRARATFFGENAMEELARILCSVSLSVTKAGDNAEANDPRLVPCEGSITGHSAGG
jgi:hypothetical protein